MSISREQAISLQESRGFEFRAEFFNLLKHYNPDPQTVDTNISQPPSDRSAAGFRDYNASDPTRSETEFLIRGKDASPGCVYPSFPSTL